MRGTTAFAAAGLLASAAAGLAQAAPTPAEVLDANHAAMGAGLDGAGALDVRYGYDGQGLTGEVRSQFDLPGRRLRRQPGHRSQRPAAPASTARPPGRRTCPAP